MALNLITEDGQQPDEESRYHEAQHQSSQENDSLLGTYLTFEQRLVDEFSVVGSGCQGDTVLLTFLEQQHIKG